MPCSLAQRGSFPVPVCVAASVIKTLFRALRKELPFSQTPSSAPPWHQVQLILALGAEEPQPGLAGRAMILYSFAKSRGSHI